MALRVRAARCTSVRRRWFAAQRHQIMFEYTDCKNIFQLLGCQTDVVEPEEEIEELSIDAEFPIPEGPPETTPKPLCERAPEAGVLFSSDNFPGKYLKDTNCTYRMKASEGKHVQLTFFFFDVS